MIVNLVNNYIKQYWKDLKKYNEANRWNKRKLYTYA
jgi:hypothetical protein